MRLFNHECITATCTIVFLHDFVTMRKQLLVLLSNNKCDCVVQCHVGMAVIKKFITSYLPAGRGAPKAWKRSGDSGGAPKKCPSVVTATCYNGCVSRTTPAPTAQLGAEAAHSDPFPIPNHPMASCSFDFRKFYRVGSEILEHQPLH